MSRGDQFKSDEARRLARNDEGAAAAAAAALLMMTCVLSLLQRALLLPFFVCRFCRCPCRLPDNRS